MQVESPVRLCEVCSCEITRKIRRSRDAGRCCSRRCGWTLLARENGFRKLAIASHAGHQRTVRPGPQVRRCPCGVEFMSSQGNKRFCSVGCRAQENVARSRRRYWLMRSLAPTPKLKRPAASRVCAGCGGAFDAIGARKFCSTRCANRSSGSGSHCQRAKAKGVPRDRSITRRAVFDRAGWTCQICGKPTPETLNSTTDPRAPELDHVVPLAAGGGHVWANVQCACRQCNHDKGARMPTAYERDVWAARIVNESGVTCG